jgi:hypothetical protein
VRLIVMLCSLSLACTPVPPIRPIEIIPQGRTIGAETLAFPVVRSPRPGLGRGDGFDTIVSARRGLSPRCDGAGNISPLWLAFSADLRCAVLSHRRGDPLTVVPFVAGGFSVLTTVSGSAADGLFARAGIDLGPPLDDFKPIAGLALATVVAGYPDKTRPGPPDGPVGPTVFRRELRLEAELGVQIGAYDLGMAVTLAFAPFWVVSENLRARPDGFVILVGGGGGQANR